MRLWQQLAMVRAAQAQAMADRTELAAAATALVARGRRYPLTVLGIVGGAGLLLGGLNLRLPRLSGWHEWLRGGVVEALMQGIRLASASKKGEDSNA